MACMMAWWWVGGGWVRFQRAAACARCIGCASRAPVVPCFPYGDKCAMMVARECCQLGCLMRHALRGHMFDIQGQPRVPRAQAVRRTSACMRLAKVVPHFGAFLALEAERALVRPAVYRPCPCRLAGRSGAKPVLLQAAPHRPADAAGGV